MCPNKIIKTFLIEEFSICIQWCTLSCEYLRDFSKIPNGPNILRGVGETVSWKKPEVENIVEISL